MSLPEEGGLELQSGATPLYSKIRVKIQGMRLHPSCSGIEFHRTNKDRRTLDFGFGLSLTRPTVPDVGRGHTQDGLARGCAGVASGTFDHLSESSLLDT